MNPKLTARSKNLKATNRGLIGIIILIVIGIFALSYFGISLRGIVQSNAGQENIGFVKETSIKVWDGVFKTPAEYLWNDIWVDLMWQPFVDTLKNIKAGKRSLIDPPPINLTPQN